MLLDTHIGHKEVKKVSNPMAAFSDKTQDLAKALDILYIPKNASGRNKFRDKWPEVALYLFGAQLIDYDMNGTSDWDHRQQLEDDAAQRRILLRETLADIFDKSVDSGVLQFEYVGKVIDAFGASLSKFIYAEHVIDRVRPKVLEEYTHAVNDQEQKLHDAGQALDDEKRAQAARMNMQDMRISTPEFPDLLPEEDRLSDAEMGILSNMSQKDDAAEPLDIFENIRPIQTSESH